MRRVNRVNANERIDGGQEEEERKKKREGKKREERTIFLSLHTRSCNAAAAVSDALPP